MWPLSSRPNTPHSSSTNATLHSDPAGGGDSGMTPNQKPNSSCYHFNPSCRALQALEKEIMWIELEITYMERYLLLLYKNAYNNQRKHQLMIHDDDDNDEYASSPASSLSNLRRINPRQSYNIINIHKAVVICYHKGQDKQNDIDCRNQSLADHLGSSSSSSTSPARLSEDIIKCISCIYHKLANPVIIIDGIACKTSEAASISCTYYNDDRYNRSCPYYGALQVTDISSVDTHDTFNYVTKMLEKFGSLIKSLEKVNPSEMKREEQLAFWINIHNALAMHAHLAYGTQDHVKSSSVIQADYNVGGHCVNAYIIQTSILGIRSHYSLPWLQNLLSSGNKYKTESMKHVYAIEDAEPLVHFALCSGAYSDPAVRVYRAKNVFNDLKLAMEEFARASIQVLKETKLVVPKIFSYLAKDMSLDVSELLKVIHKCFPEEEECNGVTKCLAAGINTPSDKYIHWLPKNPAFRYIIHRQLAQEIISCL